MDVLSAFARTAVLASLAVVLFPPGGARGEERAQSPVLPTDAVLEQLIRESLAARPELKEAEASVRAERERIPQAGALPDPMLSVGIQNDGFTSIEIGRMETSYLSVMGTQAFPWPGKRALRTEVAEMGARVADQRLSRARLSVEADVRRAYIDLLLARGRLALLDQLATLWEQAGATARARYEAGEGPQSDLLRAQLERGRIEQRRWALTAEERISVETINRLRGHPLDEPISTAAGQLRELPPPAPRSREVAMEDALARSPELAAARVGIQRAERGAALARKDYFPDITVGVGVMPRGGDFPPMWQAGLSLPLPLYAGSKQARAVSEREARAEAERYGAEAVAQLLELRVQERRVALEALEQTLRLYRTGLLVQSRATAESTLAQYAVGRVTFASVLEAIAGHIGDEDAFLQATAEAQRIFIREAEVSLEPTAVSGTVGGMSGGAMPGAGARSGGMSSPAGGGAPAQAEVAPPASMGM